MHLNEPLYTPEQVAKRNAATDKHVRRWLAELPSTEKLEFLKQLWPLNFRFTLLLVQGARLSRQESESLLVHWLHKCNHNAAQELIKRLVPVLGEKRFWRVVAQEELSPAMYDFINYHSHGRLDAERS